MILPTKRLEEKRCLIFLGAVVLEALNEPMTVSKLWKQVKQSQKGSSLSYDWFILALDLLFLMSAIDYSKGLLRKKTA